VLKQQINLVGVDCSYEIDESFDHVCLIGIWIARESCLCFGKDVLEDEPIIDFPHHAPVAFCAFEYL